MSFQYKAGFVVLCLALVFFAVAKPLFMQFMSEADFKVRRNAWLALNVVAFLAPSIWLYFGLAALICVLAVRKDSNPAVLFLFLLMAMAPYRMPIPTMGLIGQVFPMDHFRMLALAVALPVWLARSNSRGRSLPAIVNPPSARTVDICVLLYCFLQVALTMPYTSVTDSARRVLLLCLDVLLPYYLITRSLYKVEHVVQAAAALILSVMLLAPMAFFEMATQIMLWGSLQEGWSAPMLYVVLLRGGLLRAQATAGHSIVFGFACALALILWFSLLHRVRGWHWRWGGTALLCAALLSSFSRGPWVGAVAGAVALMLVAPIGLGRTLKVLGFAVVGALAVLVSPLGEPLLEYVPFVGSADTGTITYRQRLLEISLQLIARDPLTGNPYFVSYMEELRQGQGIIDLVNGIVTIALSYGLVALGIYLFSHAVVIWVALRGMKDQPDSTRWVAAGIASALMAALVTLFTTSNYLVIPYLISGLSAMGVGLIRAVATRRLNTANSPVTDPSPQGPAAGTKGQRAGGTPPQRLTRPNPRPGAARNRYNSG